jgi:hypothetical protein
VVEQLGRTIGVAQVELGLQSRAYLSLLQGVQMTNQRPPTKPIEPTGQAKPKAVQNVPMPEGLSPRSKAMLKSIDLNVDGPGPAQPTMVPHKKGPSK